MTMFSLGRNPGSGNGTSQPVRVWLRRLRQAKAPLRRLWHSLLAASLSAFLVPAAQARTYDVLTAEVPFKFMIGDRTFHPGSYQFIFVNDGLLALRDAHHRIIASLITRPVDTSGPSPATRLIFKTQKNHTRLARILLENHAQSLEIVGEEMAVRSSPQPSSSLPVGTFSFGERMDAPQLKR